MPTLSVIMIVKNEAHCLADCLGSVRSIADEIVVGDTGSEDATRAIARAHGAYVFDVPWTDDFAAARNTTIAAATGDWLLHLDADELVDPGAAAGIRALVDRDGDGCDAVELELRNYCNTPRAWRWQPAAPQDPYARTFAGYLPAGLLRLFRAGRGFAYHEPVHENITQSVVAAGGRILHSGIPVHHYGYDPGTQRAREKVRSYLAIARRKLHERPEDLKALHDLAEQALACGYVEEAEAACRKAVALEPTHTAAVCTLGNILLSRGDYAEARPLLDTLDRHGHAPVLVRVALAALDLREGYPEEAVRRLQCAIDAAPRAPLARLYMARVLDCLGRPEAARGELAVARDAAPRLTEVANRVRAHELRAEGDMLFAEGAAAGALKCFVEALRLDPDDPLLHNNAGVALHALGYTDQARESFRRALQLAPALDDARKNLEQL
ncbi:MAG: glycosyltransferase [Candidatus Hydrogenedentota bacterium]